MNRFAGIVTAAALLAAGAVGEHSLGSSGSPSVLADTASAPISTSASSASSYDALTEHAFAVASPSVVFIENVGVGSGSGVIYDSTGDIVTNAHVVASGSKYRVTLNNGKVYAATVVGTDTSDDLAVIHINASGLPAAHFASSGGFAVAQTVLAIGNPLDLQQSVTSGLISAVSRTVQEANGAYLPDAVQTSAPINPGNSGGALVNLNGTVVGIPTLEATDPQNNNGGAAQGIGFAVPSTRVTDIAHQIITTGHVAHTGRSYLGVGVGSNSQSSGSIYGFGYGSQTPISGALVGNVAAGSPAERAGVQQGDIITAANGHSVSSGDDLLVALAHSKPGSTMTLTVNRNGTTLTLSVHLGELPANQG
ncbi:MAG TPA: trypsin-like peptidase domain-containing protein [Chloroflexota bacterium]|nr:trypsin-like peptidase domain-containing protein [Chloroflexota bacterium]